jgi:hypothetical protein
LSTTVTTASTDPSFVSLKFAANDSIPYLNTAVFTLVDNTTIVNLDSLPYKTRIDSVYPTFSFASSAGSKFYFPISGYKYKKDSAILTGTDTIDFRQIVRIRNWAADGKTDKDYYIKVNVHSVDPEVYNWSKVSDNLNSINATSQKTVILNDKLFYYLNDGTNAYVYTSPDGYNWNTSTVSGLPTGTPLNDMMQFNGVLYLTQDGVNIYSSTDGLNWTKKSVADFTFKSLLYIFNGQLWAVVQSNTDNSYRFAVSSDGNIWAMTTGNIPANFPVKDFASVSYSSSTGKPKVLVFGGLSSSNLPLKNSWSSEDGVYWIDFSVENHTLDTLALGAAVIFYDSKLLAFGSRTDNGANVYKVSIDEGLSWQIPDIKRNILPSVFPARTNQSVVVYKPRVYNSLDAKDVIEQSNRIFIIGGNSDISNYSDVWTGKLNRKNFLMQEPTLYVNK